MRLPLFHYRWSWRFAASPEALWPYVSDTNRLNRAIGLPAVEQRSADADAPPGRQHMRAVRLGVPLEWDEAPFEWVRPLRYGVLRRYRRGPVVEIRMLAELQPVASGGTRLVYQVWARPKNLLGVVGIPIQVGVLNARSFDAAFRRYAELALAPNDKAAVEATGSRLASGGRARLRQLGAQLAAQPKAAPLVSRLAALIESGDDFILARLRPYALADSWHAARGDVLKLCLHATRLGLLDFQWDVLCPGCRNPRQTASHLQEVGSTVHCDSCQIDTAVNFEQLVEITFRPSPAIRPVEALEFCVGGPHRTPHIVAQQLMAGGDERVLALPLERGRYRVRVRGIPGGHLLRVADEGSAELDIRVDESPVGEALIAPTARLRLLNPTADEQLCMLERMRWSDDAVTAADVISLPLFRDLFASEALRPDQQIAVGSLAVLFTDLRGSTQLYREIGDAVAFGHVIDHFAVLRAAIQAENGVLVKTIGDAVMAVFQQPVAALRALHAARERLARPEQDHPALVLKAGVHYGACIAVTLNERLDYFGTTVNTAARLQQLSHGDDVVLSAAMRFDPEVVAWLRRHALPATSFRRALKGFAEAHELWRVPLAEAHVDQAASSSTERPSSAIS